MKTTIYAGYTRATQRRLDIEFECSWNYLPGLMIQLDVYEYLSRSMFQNVCLALLDNDEDCFVISTGKNGDSRWWF